MTSLHSMNNTILQKCLDELNKKDIRKDYVIGMLETLISLSGESHPTPVINNIPGKNGTRKKDEFQTIELSADEIESEELAKRYTTGPIGRLE